MQIDELNAALSAMNEAQRDLVKAQDAHREAANALIEVLSPGLVGIMTTAEAIAIGQRLANRMRGR